MVILQANACPMRSLDLDLEASGDLAEEHYTADYIKKCALA